MISTAGLCHQFQISCNLLILAGTANALVSMGRTVSAVMDVTAFQQFIYLAVGHNHFSQAFCLLHSLLHHFPALDTPSVVGESGNIRSHFLQVCQDFPLLPYGNRTVRINMNGRRVFNQLSLHLQIFQAVRHGLQIGHGTHTGVPASCTSRRSGFDCFLIRKSRLSEMYMHITKAGKNNI